MLLRPNAVEASPVVTQGNHRRFRIGEHGPPSTRNGDPALDLFDGGWFGDHPEPDDKVAR